MSRHKSIIKKWIEEKTFWKYNVTYYLSHESQNEFIDLLSTEVKEKVIAEIKETDIYSIMADTTPDILHQDQLSVCIQYNNNSEDNQKDY